MKRTIRRSFTTDEINLLMASLDEVHELLSYKIGGASFADNADGRVSKWVEKARRIEALLSHLAPRKF